MGNDAIETPQPNVIHQYGREGAMDLPAVPQMANHGGFFDQISKNSFFTAVGAFEPSIDIAITDRTCRA